MREILFQELLPLLAKQHGILLLSNRVIETFDAIKPHFASSLQRNSTHSVEEHLNTILEHHGITIVVLDTELTEGEIARYIAKINVFNPKIHLVLLYDRANASSVLPFLSAGSAVVERSECAALMPRQLFMIMSMEATLERLACIELPKGEAAREDREAEAHFFDTYEGAALFLIEDIDELAVRIEDGELSLSLLKSVSETLQRAATVFEGHPGMLGISESLKEFSDYTARIGLEKIDRDMMKGFDYLAAILQDISCLFRDIFVNKKVKESYIFEHSLSSNIRYLYSALEKKSETEESRLDFFE